MSKFSEIELCVNLIVLISLINIVSYSFMTSLRNAFQDSHCLIILVWLFLIVIKIWAESFIKILKLLTDIILLQYFLLHQRFQNFHISHACSQFVFMFVIMIFDYNQNQVLIHDFSVFMIHFMIHVSKNNHQFSSFTHSAEANHEKWFWWIFFIKMSVFFLLLCMIFMFFVHIFLIWSAV